jgi:hypothetical protein
MLQNVVAGANPLGLAGRLAGAFLPALPGSHRTPEQAQKPRPAADGGLALDMSPEMMELLDLRDPSDEDEAVFGAGRSDAPRAVAEWHERRTLFESVDPLQEAARGPVPPPRHREAPKRALEPPRIDVPAPPDRRLRMERIGNAPVSGKAQAMAALQAFERDCQAYLPQLRGDAEDLQDFIQGLVVFERLRDLAVACPCAASIVSVVSPGGGPPLNAAVYPESALQHLVIGLVRVGEQICMNRKHPQADLVQVSTDRQRWHTTSVYTDRDVEAAKLAMWLRLVELARVLRRALPTGARIA